MTFNKAAWAIDGATINSALARAAVFASNSGAEGLVEGHHLRVQPLASPGNGLRIGLGSALIRNRYQGTTPDQMYTVTNPSEHLVTGADMPATSASQQSYIVAVVVGDPEFSQAGHPFMPTTVPPGTEASFTYVRPVVIPEASFNARTYPALALARLVIPANTTTITAGMITDLRAMARPRRSVEVWHAIAPATGNGLGTGWERFPNVNTATGFVIPSWATYAKIVGFIEGLRLDKAGAGRLQGRIISGGVTKVTNLTEVDEYLPNNTKDRRAYNYGGVIDVSDIAGQQADFSVRAMAMNTASTNFLVADATTSILMTVHFEEAPRS